MPLLPDNPMPLAERGGASLEWDMLRARVAGYARSALGRAWLEALEPSLNAAWIARQQERAEQMARLTGGSSERSFEFRGLFEATEMLGRARIDGSALDADELLAVLTLVERFAAWRALLMTPTESQRAQWPAITAMSEPLLAHNFDTLLRALRGKLDPDGTVSDDASQELRRIRRALARQHKDIEEALGRVLTRLSAEGSTQDALITVRGERFVIPVKTEFRRRVNGVIHGASSSGGTVFVEPMETIEANNELIRLLDEEQAEVHRILVAMTRAVGAEAAAIAAGTEVLAEADALQAIARFAVMLECVRPVMAAAANHAGLELVEARHPLLELRLREADAAITPLTIRLDEGARQMIISGPNTGGKTVALKTTGLLALMAQAGLPVPAATATLPVFAAIYADIGDAQSIENNLSTFSAHVLNIDRIARVATPESLVLLDELGSATDPEEGAALAVAVAKRFLSMRVWNLITTHLTSLKIYASSHMGVANAAVGFDEVRLQPTYELRLGVPGASAGLNIAARLGMDAAIITDARTQLSTQTIDIGRFLDDLHAQLAAAKDERADLEASKRQLAHQRMIVETEGRAEQKARTRELGVQLETLIKDFETQMRDAVKSIDDKAIAQKLQRDSALRVARLRREFSEQFATTVETHTQTPAEAAAKTARRDREPALGDLVRLSTLGREGRVTRVIDAKNFEVTVGSMKTRVARRDIAEVVASARTVEKAERKVRGVSVTTAHGDDDSDYLRPEINVIGRSADEAEADVAQFIERAFMAGLSHVRVVHGVGMGVLRRTLREYLRAHPHVTHVSEPPYNEGGQGATLVDLRV